MEPAYWAMRRIAQNIPPSLPESEYAALEVTPPPVAHPGSESDPDAPIEAHSAAVPLLSPECGRVVTQGGWRVLRPAVPG
ncbi:MAG: hypothetical protein L3K06_00945 [Thermoplasmata archaeon]|nr:hypothetical protein [Thermoplasmata archaeon]MCI4353916.1 hypothetical protein [Thermoplasmata archaeon]